MNQCMATFSVGKNIHIRYYCYYFFPIIFIVIIIIIIIIIITLVVVVVSSFLTKGYQKHMYKILYADGELKA